MSYDGYVSSFPSCYHEPTNVSRFVFTSGIFCVLIKGSMFHVHEYMLCNLMNKIRILPIGQCVSKTHKFTARINTNSVYLPVMPCRVLYERLRSLIYPERFSHVSSLTLASDMIAPARSLHYVVRRYSFSPRWPLNSLIGAVPKNLSTFLKKLLSR